MIVSYNWLKELIKVNEDVKSFVDKMTLHLVEVETCTRMVNATNLVCGEVLTCVPHENSDHLHVCKVNIGEKVEQIVCGAPNVAEGEKVIVALPGAKLPGGEIKPCKVRGVESNGMLCSLQELGIEQKYVPAEYQNGIYLLGSDAVCGQSALEYLCMDDDLIELSLTPNRMDLMGMLGVAHDVRALYHLPIEPLNIHFNEIEEKTSDNVSVDLETSNCYSYYARVVKDVKIKESPRWLKARLIASGIRPINNVVDITNYVLQLFSQPLHSFDMDLLGNKIIVRRAKDGEKLVTLDDVERTLNHSDIVISDNIDNNRAVCLAGVMGGKSTEVTESTKNIVLESAVFRPLSVRKTSARLGLRSESSSRYEHGVDLNQSLDAINYACMLLEQLADGKVCQGYVHVGKEHINDRVIKITRQEVENYLGIDIPTDTLEEMCKYLDFGVERDNDTLTVSVPNRRMDISIKPDLIEEFARLHGYENLNETLPYSALKGELTKEQKIRRLINNTFRGLGLSEVVTYSLVSKELSEQFKILYDDSCEPLVLLHPMTDERCILRRTLTPSLIEVIKYNNARKLNDLAIYEVGKTYYTSCETSEENWHCALALQGKQNGGFFMNQEKEVDFYYVKGLLDNLFAKLRLNVKYVKPETVCKELHPGRTANIVLNNEVIGYVGELHPEYTKKADIAPTYVAEFALDKIFTKKDKTITFEPISKVPTVERDLALVMKKTQGMGEVIDQIIRCDKNMIKNVKVFDVYEGEHVADDEKSVAVRITLGSKETLTDEVIASKMKKIINTLAYRFGITLRK